MAGPLIPLLIFGGALGLIALTTGQKRPPVRRPAPRLPGPVAPPLHLPNFNVPPRVKTMADEVSRVVSFDRAVLIDELREELQSYYFGWEERLEERLEQDEELDEDIRWEMWDASETQQDAIDSAFDLHEIAMSVERGRGLSRYKDDAYLLVTHIEDIDPEINDIVRGHISENLPNAHEMLYGERSGPRIIDVEFEE